MTGVTPESPFDWRKKAEELHDRAIAVVKDEAAAKDVKMPDPPEGWGAAMPSDAPFTAERKLDLAYRLINLLKKELGTSCEAEIFAAETLLLAFYTSSTPGYREALLHGGLR